MRHGSGRRLSGLVLVVAVGVATGFMPPASAGPTASGTTTRVSKAADGTYGDLSSGAPVTSGDGRYVAFIAYARNLVAGDTNEDLDVFVHDRNSGATSRVSVASDGAQGSGPSLSADISADGRFVSFSSRAPNLVPFDTNGVEDVFVHDRQTATTTRVSVSSAGLEARTPSGAPSISPDGRYVAFASLEPFTPDDTVGVDDRGRPALSEDVYIHDRDLATTTRVSVPRGGIGAGGGGSPDVSRGGRFVAFQSRSSSLVAGDTNGSVDVFVRDLEAASTRRITNGTQAGGTALDPDSEDPAIDDSGRFVAFQSYASNLVPGDTNRVADVFVHDLGTGTTTRVSKASDGTQGGGDPVPESNFADISADGRFVSFASLASNLVANDTNDSRDVFVHDRDTGVTTRVSRASDGTQGNAKSDSADISADGRYVSFASNAWSLAPGDDNLYDDVFIHDRHGVPGPAPVLAAAGDATVAEGDAGRRAAVLTVSLSRPAATTVTVGYVTIDGPPGGLGFAPRATSGTDYTPRSGTLSFAPGVTSLPVKVPIHGDDSDEGDEVFTLELTGATGAKVGDVFGVGTIIDADPATLPGRHLAIGDVAVNEGDSGSRLATFTVSLSIPATAVITVDFATAAGTATDPDDYVGRSGTLSFAPGSTSAVVKVTVNPDHAAERGEQATPGGHHGSEAFKVVLSGASGPAAVIVDAVGVGTIFDDD